MIFSSKLLSCFDLLLVVRYLLCCVQSALYKDLFRNTNFNFETERRPWDRNFSYPVHVIIFFFAWSGHHAIFATTSPFPEAFLSFFSPFVRVRGSLFSEKFRCCDALSDWSTRVFFFHSADYSASYCFFFFRAYKSRVLSRVFMAPFKNVKKRFH